MTKNADKKAKNMAAGQAMKKARGDRPVSAVVSQLPGVSVGRYQHWEKGNNAPDRELWRPLGDALGLDVAALYGGVSAPPSRGGKMISAQAVMGLVQSIEAQLVTLKTLCSDTAPNRVLERAGIRPVKNRVPQRKKETA